jgi:hypothetical protein
VASGDAFVKSFDFKVSKNPEKISNVENVESIIAWIFKTKYNVFDAQ